MNNGSGWARSRCAVPCTARSARASPSPTTDLLPPPLGRGQDEGRLRRAASFRIDSRGAPGRMKGSRDTLASGRSLRQRVQHVDRVTHVQAFSEPTGARCPRVDPKALRVVTRPERLDRITRHRGGRRHLRQRVAIRPLEPELAVWPARNLEAILVHRAMMPATEHREVGQRRRSSVRPVAEMMPLAEGQATAREAAAVVPSVERPS
jgi:hypothetical protein